MTNSTTLPRFALVSYVILSVLKSLGIVFGSSGNPYEFSALERRAGQAQNNQSGCTLPEYPNFGHWSIVGGSQGKPSQMVPFTTVLEVNCNEGYSLSTQYKYVICIGIEWYIHEELKCLKKCPPLYISNSTNVKCFDDNNFEIDCNEAVNGTSATFQCSPYTESGLHQIRARRYCIDGFWNLPEPVCRPVCGVEPAYSKSSNVTFESVKQALYPWVVMIYHKQTNGSYLHICSGSMLTENVLVTAATCVTDEKGDLILKQDLAIAAGKYYNEFRDSRDADAQYSQVDQVMIPDRAVEHKQRFGYDIAVLIITERLTLSNVVQPVCYQGVPEFSLSSGDVGVITRWGYVTTSNKSIEKLQELEVSYKNRSECQKEFSTEWVNKYYTLDKICVELSNMSTFTSTDIGGGLFFKHNDRYYLHGVLSVDSTPKTNDLQIYPLYTNVSQYFNWLEKLIAQKSAI